MFTYLKQWFRMIYHMFFPLRTEPHYWDPMLLDAAPICTPTRTIGTIYAPVRDSLSYRRKLRDLNLRRAGLVSNNWIKDQTCSGKYVRLGSPRVSGDEPLT